jgi:hypothetical protein
VRLSFPLHKLECEACGVAGTLVPSPASATTRCAFKVPLPEGDEVTIEVERVELLPKGRGIYDAYAVAYVDCPSCGQSHEARLQTRALSVHVEISNECDCGEQLKFDSRAIIFSDKGEQGPTIEVYGRLLCSKCAAREVSERLPTPDFDSIRRAGKLEVLLPAA